MNNSEQKDILPPDTYGPCNALEKFRQAMLDYPECVGMVGPSSSERLAIKPTHVWIPVGVDVTDEQIQQLTGNPNIEIVRMGATP